MLLVAVFLLKRPLVSPSAGSYAARMGLEFARASRCLEPALCNAMVLTSAHAASSAALSSHTGRVVHGTEPNDEAAELVSVPELRLLRAMNISPHHAHLYQRMFGPATPLHPYGTRVHAGLVDLVRSCTYRHRERFLGPPHVQYCLWVCYSSPYNKRQMMCQRGDHPQDARGGEWFAAVGDWHDGEWWAVCLGAAWANGPPWRIHPSRVVVCLPHSQEVALERALALPNIEIVADDDFSEWQNVDVEHDPEDSEWF